MATPSFIYAFDNLGPARFVELCGLLLGSRYRGFVLSSSGPDGGVDAESVPSFGELRPESRTAVLDDVFPARKLIVFQFKHKTVARVGQANARKQLLRQYQSIRGETSEVRKLGVLKRRPGAYVLVTNVEVNSEFRQKFVDRCRAENPRIPNYQLIGLDDLEAWVTLDRQLRAQFFPTIFAAPNFDLRIKLDLGWLAAVARSGEVSDDRLKVLSVTVQNIGLATSYLDKIMFKSIIDGKPRYLLPTPGAPGESDPRRNPKFGQPLESGRCEQFRYLFEMFLNAAKDGPVFLVEAMVWDQVGNLYTAEITDDIREAIFPKQPRD